MTVPRSLVSVVDDDESVRESLPDLLRVCGFPVQAFSSAEEFLASEVVGQTKCLILDIAMPGMTGPALQQELRRRRQEIPVECLFKPFGEAALLDAVSAALRPPYCRPARGAT